MVTRAILARCPSPQMLPLKAIQIPATVIATSLCSTATTAGCYELYKLLPARRRNRQAASGSVWDLLNNNQRPATWTSADAAGLPIFPGLVRYDEVASGQINHALRFTLQRSGAAFVPPATHWAANSTNPNAAPMGMRVRLKADYDISSFPPQSKVILAALKSYGMIMADNGSNMFLIGAPDDRWNNDDLHSLRKVPASAVSGRADAHGLHYIQRTHWAAPLRFRAQGRQPNHRGGKITTLNSTGLTRLTTSSPRRSVRCTTQPLHPTATTTYAPYATNQSRRQKATVTVTVQ